MRKVIVNSTPLIVLCNIGELDILRSMYGEITIPKAVYDEVTVKEDTACSILKDSPDWIHIEELTDESKKRMYKAKLHEGEVEVMILAQECRDEALVIIDDDAAKRTARFLDITAIGTLGVLIKAKQLGIISEIKPMLDRLQKKGFYISERLYKDILYIAGE